MKFVIRSLVVLTVFSVVISVAPVFAQSRTMTDEHIARIKANCQLALGTLSRIHANDAPQYVNRNQTYYSISDKMMARLNSRLTLNRYDATQLVRTASDFNEALDDFRAAYKTYDDTMADLIRMDCQRAPVTFYDKVAAARQQREKVHQAVVQLQALIGQYRDDVKTFQALHFAKSEGDQYE